MRTSVLVSSLAAALIACSDSHEQALDQPGALEAPSPASSARGAPPARALPELLVRVSPAAARTAATATPGLTAEAVVAALAAAPQGAAPRAASPLYPQLHRPSGARFVITSRLAPELRARLSPEHPLEQLHQWIILEYPSRDDAAAAHALLAIADPLLEISPNAPVAAHSSLPADPLYSFASNVGASGLLGTSTAVAHALLKLPAAWEHLPGHAYLSPIDNGAEPGHPDLQGNLRPHFSRNSWDGNGDFDEAAIFGTARGHGTHVAGIMAARAHNGAGTSGACQTCSLSVIRTTYRDGYSCASVAGGIHEALASGSQVLSFSFGLRTDTPGACVDPATGQLTGVMATAIALASLRQASLTAATGNDPDLDDPNDPDDVPVVQAPANHPSVLAIGATTATGAWAEFSTSGPALGDVDLVAPGDKIFSTFHTGSLWKDTSWTDYPGTTCTSEPGALAAYGYCSGTSMAAPLVAGVLGILRSANPLLSRATSANLLRDHASRAAAPTLDEGHGLPDAGKSVAKALYGPGGNQGTTPLFTFYSETQSNHFYTTVPQMASSAMCGTLRHGAAGAQPPANAYLPAEGTFVSGYILPDDCWDFGTLAMRAAVRLFTTRSRFGQELKPLYRMSWHGTSDPPGGGTVSHAYTTNGVPGDVGIANFVSAGYVLDGVEGYVYPSWLPQPEGTVKLHRRYHAGRDDYALFPEAELGSFLAQGYVDVFGADFVGYVCPQGSAGTGICRNVTRTASDYVKASNTLPTSFFGSAVALSADGSTLAVGSYGEDSAATGVNGDQLNTAARSSGAVYVYVRSGSSWVQQAYLKASNTGSNDYFGDALALSADGSTLAVGARMEDSAATGVNGAQFDNSANNAGAVYVFTRAAGSWSQQAYVKASNTSYAINFGSSVALSGDGETLAVGAPSERSNATGINGNQLDASASGAGAVYVFTRAAGAWSQQAYVKASNTNVVDHFGTSVALSGDGTTLAVGAQYEDSAADGVNGDQLDNSASNAGAAYVFIRAGATWSQQAYLKASNSDPNDSFGNKVSLSADGATLAVSAPSEASTATGVNGDQTSNAWPGAGAAYVFTRAAGAWTQRAYLKPSNTAYQDFFGYSLALSGDGTALVVGAYLEDGGAPGIDGNPLDDSVSNAGAAYLFTGFGSAWRQQSYLKATSPGLADLLGASAAISGNGSLVAVGASYEDGSAAGVNGPINDAAGDAGAVYVFR